MANENKPLNEAKPNEPITAQRWNDMQVALRKEHIEHRHTGTWRDGNYDGDRIAADGLADGAVTNPRLADNAVTGPKIDQSSDIRVRTAVVTGDKLPASSPALQVTGTVGITGMLKAGKDTLTVTSDYVEVGGALNPLRLTSAWSGFPETKNNAAEIANDTGTYKALMILGNKSAGGVRRVGLWDRVDVYGRLVVGPGADAGITVNGPVDSSAVKTGDLNVTTLATVAALKVVSTLSSGPVTITGALSVSEPVSALKGLQVGAGSLYNGNRLQVQGGATHLDGNPLYLRAGVNDQYDVVRWNASLDTVDVAGYNGVNIGYTRTGQGAGVSLPVLSVRDTYLEFAGAGNPLRITANWSNFTGTGVNAAEISNDTSSYKTLMIVGNRSNGGVRRVSVSDRLEVNGDLTATALQVFGNSTVNGRVAASAYNLYFYTYTFAAANNGTTYRDTPISYSGVGFVQIYAAYAVFNGFSLFSNNAGFTSWGAVQSDQAIPQHAFATVVSYNNSAATVRTFCSESRPEQGGDNTVLATLVVIGRTA